MKSIFAVLVPALAGIVCGVVLCANLPFRSAIAGWFGAGKMVALVEGTGIYDRDVERAKAETRFSISSNIARSLIADEVAAHRGRTEKLSHDEINGALTLLRSQFPDEKIWRMALRASQESGWSTLR